MRSSLSTCSVLFVQQGATSWSPSIYRRQNQVSLSRMSVRREALRHCAVYLNTSPIARLVYWATGRNNVWSDDDTSGEPSTCLAKEEDNRHSTVRKVVAGVIADEDSRDRHGICARRATANAGDSEVHNWPLARRILIAAVISWYT
jgi:hypothetical protein